MTPEEHYIEAERLLVVAEQCDWQTAPRSPEFRDHAFADTCIAAAQAHALLATPVPGGVAARKQEADRG